MINADADDDAGPLLDGIVGSGSDLTSTRACASGLDLRATTTETFGEVRVVSGGGEDVEGDGAIGRSSLILGRLNFRRSSSLFWDFAGGGGLIGGLDPVLDAEDSTLPLVQELGGITMVRIELVLELVDGL